MGYTSCEILDLLCLSLSQFGKILHYAVDSTQTRSVLVLPIHVNCLRQVCQSVLLEPSNAFSSFGTGQARLPGFKNP